MNIKSDEEYRKDWYSIASDPYQWINHGHRLTLSAYLVANEFNKVANSNRPGYTTNDELLSYSDTYMMLLGLAFENVAKGISIWQNPNFVESDKLTGITTSGHYIHELVAKILPDLSPDQEKFLLSLTEYTTWKGKYPVPKTPKKYIQAYTPEPKLTVSPETDRVIIEEIFQKLRQIIHP